MVKTVVTTEEFGWRSVRSAFSHLRAVFDIYWQYMQAKRLHEQQQAQVKAGETSASPLVQVKKGTLTLRSGLRN